ncbi:hypothetical protein H7J71_02125 [Mycolicibacterium peregrinum]|uniref:hypothetical protein n=1 Tax=Mycolicibacterium peregrinum TaxID=43304 RepID=UPI000AB86E98|nr:hypothetical protein [Mycolicibacterium peregrinum]MCV7200808.1 hypothetical protein [Mycolicibacterium peregrinum]
MTAVERTDRKLNGPGHLILDEYPTAPQARVALPAYRQSCAVEHPELVAHMRRTLRAAE